MSPNLLLCTEKGEAGPSKSDITVVNYLTQTVRPEWKQQDDEAGILHQVAQFPIDQVYFIYTRRPCSSTPMQDPERQGTGC